MSTPEKIDEGQVEALETLFEVVGTWGGGSVRQEVEELLDYVKRTLLFSMNKDSIFIGIMVKRCGKDAENRPKVSFLGGTG